MKTFNLKLLAGSALFLLNACGNDAVSVAETDAAADQAVIENSGVPGDASSKVEFPAEEEIIGSPDMPIPSPDVNPTTPEASVVTPDLQNSSSSFAAPFSSATATSTSSGVLDSMSSAVEVPYSSAEMVPYSSSSFISASNGNSPAISYTAAGASVVNDNGCVSINGGEVVIGCAGDYDFSGSYSGADAQIRVYAPKADSGVYLNLRGLTLENTADAPIYVQMASKVFVVAKSESNNVLSDGKTRSRMYTYINGNGVEKTDTTGAAIYAKDDITFKGTGSLTINGNYNNGIQSSNDIRFRGETTIKVTAANNGIKGKGMVDVEKGNITISAIAGDGIKSDECTVNGTDTTVTEGKGIVNIKGGTINITKAGDDGIQAFNYVVISDSVNVPVLNVNSTGKGIVSDNWLYVNGGEINVTSVDDGVHSNMNVYFNGGYTTISTDTKKGDGVHADSTLYINDGTIYVKQSYEGLEGWYIKARGGVTAVVASDDGWNAAGGNDGSGNTNNFQPGGWNQGGRPGMGGMGGSSSGSLVITGGAHYVKTGSGDVDGIDSNGELTISGGVVVVECQISGGMGGSFDADGTTSITSKTVLGLSRGSSEKGTNYNVSFNTNSYYGNSSIAFKPTTSGSYAQGTSQVSAVGNVNSYANSVKFPSGDIVYYN